MKWGVLLILASFGVTQDSRDVGHGDKVCQEREGGFIVQRDYRDCVDLLGSERIRGLWFVGLEESAFSPEGATVTSVRILSEETIRSETRTWLDAGWPEQQRLLERVPEPGGLGETSVYAVEFLGRRARDAGQYGHNGNYRHLIILDELVSIRPVGRIRTRVEMFGLSCWIDECAEAIARREGRLRD